MNKQKVDRILQVGILVLVAGLIGVLYNTIHERIVNVGDSAPAFSITASNGRTITAADFGGKVLVLNFWATWCEPCVDEMPSLNALARRFQDRGLVVLGVSVDKDENAYKQFLTRLKISFPTARDPEQKVNQDYGTVQFPETYIINAQGKVVDKIISAVNWTDDKMVNHVQSLL
jgi:cytochrome c biogenesis protein CcmG, thiol:disulfide interchange protein DsbE